MNIRNQLLLSFLSLIGLTMFFGIYNAQKELRPRYLEAVEDTLVDASNYMAQTIESSFVDPRTHVIKTEELQKSWAQLLRMSPQARIYAKGKSSIEMRIYVTDQKGVVILDTASPSAVGLDYSQWNDVLRTLRGQYGARSTREVPDDDMTSVLFVAAPIRSQNNIIGVVSLGKPLSSFNSFMLTARRNLIIGVGISLVLALVLSLFLSRGISAPIERELDARAYIKEYVHHLTHEFKSPLTGIIGAAELLENQKNLPDSDRTKLLDNILSEGQRLKEITENLLELAALEKRSTHLKKEKIDCNDFIDELSEHFSSQILAKKLKIDLKFSQPGPILFGDRFLLWRALANLLQNAIDFSAGGSRIEIESASQPGAVVITVRDEGVGIPEEIRSRIFEKFFSTTRPDSGKKGTGLGLPFVKEVAEQHGGGIEIARNSRSQGVEAVFRIPSGHS